jgi:hypothetical protein
LKENPLKEDQIIQKNADNKLNKIWKAIHEQNKFKKEIETITKDK